MNKALRLSLVASDSMVSNSLQRYVATLNTMSGQLRVRNQETSTDPTIKLPKALKYG